jgi:signal transduction histidine kinase
MEIVDDQERSRVSDLKSYGIMDTPPEVSYNQLAFIASIICDTPVALVSFVDSERQWFKAAVGIDIKEIPRKTSMCIKTLEQDNVIVISDMTKNPDYSDNYYVVEKKFVFYAGVPLISCSGHRIGTLCVLDWKPHTLTSEQVSTLKIIAQQIIDQSEMRKRYREGVQDIWEISKSKQEMEHKYQSIIYTAKTRALAEIVSGISLKISDPLNMIKGGAGQIAQLMKDPENSRDLLERELELIETNCSRISDTLRSMKVFRQIHNNEGLKPLDFSQLVHDVSSLTLSKINQVGKFEMDIEEDIMIIGNFQQLAQALNCLFINASEAVEKLHDKKISIDLKRVGRFAVLKICDWGLGVEDHIHEFIFQPFFSTKDEVNHPGLGLSLCKTIVERHSGIVELVQTHRPTIFSLKLPLPTV